MKLQSNAFNNVGRIPSRFTCDGAGVSPGLAWQEAPPHTQSFAIICRDPDAPSGTWYHWAVFDIPKTCSALAEGQTPAATRQGTNDFGKQGYGGPCPPRGHGIHHYQFVIYALDVDHLEVTPRSGCRDIEKAAKAHAIATAQLVGTYER